MESSISRSAVAADTRRFRHCAKIDDAESRGIGRRSMDCLRASEEEWRWLQKAANALQKLEIGSSAIVLFFSPNCISISSLYLSFRISESNSKMAGYLIINSYLFNLLYVILSPSACSSVDR
ncbi:hypothetical protein V8G54_019570, partial [Vigna mungo]